MEVHRVGLAAVLVVGSAEFFVHCSGTSADVPPDVPPDAPPDTPGALDATLSDGAVDAGVMEIDAAKSILWAAYQDFAPCYTWFGFHEDDAGVTPSHVYGEDDSQCAPLPGRDESDAEFAFRGDGGAPTYHIQTASLAPWERGPMGSRPSFDFVIGDASAPRTIELVNDGRMIDAGVDVCGRQRELGVTFFGQPKSTSEMIPNAGAGRAYTLGDFAALTLEFDAKITLEASRCPTTAEQITIFKPSFLFELPTSGGGRGVTNALIIDLEVIAGNYRGPGERVPSVPEVRAFNDCVSPAVPGVAVCTVHVDGTVVTRTDLGNGWAHYATDLVRLTQRYADAGIFRTALDGGGPPLGDSQLRALQFIVTQRGGLAAVQLRNMNLRSGVP